MIRGENDTAVIAMAVEMTNGYTNTHTKNSHRREKIMIMTVVEMTSPSHIKGENDNDDNDGSKNDK